jgi:hypothetical protein
VVQIHPQLQRIQVEVPKIAKHLAAVLPLSGRYNPTVSIDCNGHALQDDLMQLEIRQAITNTVSTFSLTLDNLNDKWTNVLRWNDPITITIEGTRKFKGRLDMPETEVSKKDGRIMYLSGREDGGALQDVESSLHFASEKSSDIIQAILDEYNNRRLTGDPAITMGVNLAPTDIYMSPVWKRKSLWSMLLDVANLLGCPVEVGGKNQFFDFWITPYDELYFVPTGTYSSGVTIPPSTETIKARRIVDSLPVANDVWIWAAENMGTIPLTMQPGYPGAINDPWTESNTTYWKCGDHITSITGDQSQHIIGDWSLKINLDVAWWLLFGSPDIRAWWYLEFPFSEWPGQPPQNHFNVYNETSMTETMGEITGINFFLKTDTPFDFLIEVKDTCLLLADSNPVHVDPGGPFANWFNPVWVPVNLPFGPSGNYKVRTDTTQPLDWSAIAEVRFVMWGIPAGLGTFNLWFDGLRFVKPLVVSATKTGSPTYPDTRRTLVKQATEISSYAAAKAYALAVLENESNPQIYWQFENLGRVDIPIGYKFNVGSLELLMRELTYSMSKDKGLIINGVGWEAT